MSENYNEENKDHITDLDARLDNFLAEQFDFDLENAEINLDEKKIESPEPQEIKNQQVIGQIPQSTELQQSPPPVAPVEKRDVEQELRNLKVDKELEEIKKRVKPSENSSKQVVITGTAADTEKKFKDKEIDKALELLKSKSSLETDQQKPVDTKIVKPVEVSDEEVNKSITDLLKKIN